MQPSQWLYTSPVYSEALQISKDGWLAAAVGSVVTVSDPYRLERRPWFSEPKEFTPASITAIGARPKEVKKSITFTLETLSEFLMRDAFWRATVRSIAWSPPHFYRNGFSSILAVVQSDKQILVYGLPQIETQDHLDLLVNLTEAYQVHLQSFKEWNMKKEGSLLRLRGGGRPKKKVTEERKRDLPISKETQDIIDHFQFPREADAILVSSIEQDNSRRFRLDIPKVVLALWLELRNEIPENDLPTYRKGEFLFGVDLRIYERVIQHMLGLYGEVMKTYEITRKYVESRSRALIRNKAIMSFDRGWKGRRFAEKNSVLSLIGQDVEEDDVKGSASQSMPLPTIVSSEEAAVCIKATCNTVKQVKPQSGKKRKGTGQNKICLISHFLEEIENDEYDWRREALSVTCVAWSETLKCVFTVLAVGNEAGMVTFWKYDLSEHAENDISRRFHILGSQILSKSGICSLKWKVIDFEKGRNAVFLTVADASGSVSLWRLNTEAVNSNNEIWGPLLVNETTIAKPDLRPVSALQIDVFFTESEPFLQICIGKPGGVFSVWRGPPLSAQETSLEHWMSKGKLYSKLDCHSNRIVTGIVSNRITNSIVTVGLDDELCHWKIENEELTCFHSEWISMMTKESDIESIYGIVKCPCDVLIVVLKDLGEKHRDAQEHRILWKRLVHGSLEIKSLLNFDTDTSWLILKDHAERKLQENAHPSFWVALGQLIRRVMTAEPSIPDVPDPREANSSEDEMLVDEKQDDEMESSENRDLQKRQVHALSFVQGFLDALTETRSFSSETEMQRLRAACALYHTICKTDGIEVNGERIKETELMLLHHHVLNVLNKPKPTQSFSGDVQSPFSEEDWNRIRAEMVEWVLRFEMCLDSASSLEAARTDDNDPLKAATKWIYPLGDSVFEFKRCVSTFLLIDGTTIPWTCPVCFRQYLFPPSTILSQNSQLPLCLFCGILLRK